IWGDRAAVLLFTGRRVQKDFFDEVPGGVALNQQGRAVLLTHLNERLDKAVRYPVQGSPGKTRNVKQRDIIQHEAHALANALLGKNDLPLVVETRALWEEKTAQDPVDPEEDEDEAGESPAEEA